MSTGLVAKRRRCLVQRAGVLDAFLDEPLGVADVLERAAAELMDRARRAVLCLGDVAARLAEELERALEPAAPGRPIDRLVVGDVLAIVDRRLLDLA